MIGDAFYANIKGQFAGKLGVKESQKEEVYRQFSVLFYVFFNLTFGDFGKFKGVKSNQL